MRRRGIFALFRSFWDARDAVGDHILVAALSAVTVAVLIAVFASRGDLLPALYSLLAVWVVFLVFVAAKFTQAFRHPDQHRDWELLDFRIEKDAWRVEVRYLGPRRRALKPLLCRVIAPDGINWISQGSATFIPDRHGLTSRMYPMDFKCPKCGQAPPVPIPLGEYEITWSEPRWGPVRRPLLRYSRQWIDFAQAPAPSEPGS
jgi:hypothetical protein